MVKAILFDFGGTLDSDGLHWQERFYPLYADAGIQVGREEFARAFYDADDNLHLKHDLRGIGLEQTVALQVRDLMNNLGMNSESAAVKIKNAFVSECRKNFKINIPVLKWLKNKYKLAIVSNFYGNMDAILKSEGLDVFFDAVADSTMIGAMKPDAEIFLYPLEKFGIKPEHALMVGDSVKRDMKGAEALNMPHAWIKDPHGRIGQCCDKAMVLNNIRELPGILTT